MVSSTSIFHHKLLILSAPSHSGYRTVCPGVLSFFGFFAYSLYSFIFCFVRYLAWKWR